MNLSVIAATGKNGELGLNNSLIWHLKGDMKFFKEITTGHTIIMGRKTFNSLPKLLPQRKHLVLSRSLNIPGVTTYKDIETFLKDYKQIDEEVFNIGGASVYAALLEYTDKIYLTEIEATAKADTYFPYFDKENYTSQILDVNEENGIQYRHVLYKRRR